MAPGAHQPNIEPAAGPAHRVDRPRSDRTDRPGAKPAASSEEFRRVENRRVVLVELTPAGREFTTGLFASLVRLLKHAARDTYVPELAIRVKCLDYTADLLHQAATLAITPHPAPTESEPPTRPVTETTPNQRKEKSMAVCERASENPGWTGSWSWVPPGRPVATTSQPESGATRVIDVVVPVLPRRRPR